MPDHFSASVAPTATEAAQPGLGEDFEREVERDAEARLYAALDRVDARVQAVRAADADRELEPEVLAALTRAAEADGAPFEARWLAGKVAEGDLTWAAVWHAPEEHEGGLWLCTRATQELAGGAPR